MELEKLLTVLEEQNNNLFDLYSNLKKQQTALTANNADDIESAIIEQEKILHNIRNKEQQRILFVAEICSCKDFDFKNNSISEILRYLQIKDIDMHDKLLSIKNEISSTMKKINVLNGQNSYIIENSRKFIRDLMQNLYDISKKNFLDRKI